MCGIFGHVGFLEESLARNCLQTIAHRGPDSGHLWQQPEITLGHRRLAILDLSDQGKQPMSYSNDRYWITFNGEIYNFLELRTELQRCGHTFRSDTDTEVILAAFAEWGEQCQFRFNGMWAFAIWDDQEKKLFLSRDRLGKKPLFYAQVPKGFAFASEMKALFPLLPQIRPNLPLIKDPKRIFQYESTDECLIEGIQRFPAGHCGWWSNNQLKLKRWWCTLDHLLEVPVRYEEQVEQFRSLFLDACRLRMRSDVPIGTALSGGLDSSSTLAAMAHIAKHDPSLRISSDWQHAFVARFPGTPLDESYYAQLVTDHLGIQVTFVDIDPLQAIDRLYDHLYLFEDLYITSPIPFMMTYAAIRAKGVKVSIDGHGADELFGGYSFDYIYALQDAGLNWFKANQILTTLYDSYPQGSNQFRLPPKLKFWLTWYAKQSAKRVLKRSRNHSRDLNHPQFKRLDTLNQILYQSTHETTLPTLLRNYDRYSMANGVEIRMPFLDHRILSFAFSIPWTSKIRQGFSKAIIRDAVAPLMPADVAYRKSKIGFNSPIVDWMKGPLKPFFLDTIHSDAFKSCELIDAAEVAKKIQQVIQDPNISFQMGEQAWTALTPYLWEQALIRKNTAIAIDK